MWDEQCPNSFLILGAECGARDSEEGGGLRINVIVTNVTVISCTMEG